jgi:hypothetical protein
MRHFKVSAFLAVILFASTGNVLAQTGEFAATVPGSVVHEGYALQDWLQEQRNGRYEPAPLANVQDPVIIVPPPREPPPPRPRKTAKKVTTTSQVQPKQQQ